MNHNHHHLYNNNQTHHHDLHETNPAGQSFASSLLHLQQPIHVIESTGGSRTQRTQRTQESIYSNAQLSHSNSSSVHSSGVNGSLGNNINSSYSSHLNHDNIYSNGLRRGSSTDQGLPPPSPPRNVARFSCNNNNRLHYDHEYQNQQNLNELLILENREIKSEVDDLKKQIKRFEQLEEEVSRVHSAHEELMRSADKKERLERAVRYKLEIEINRLQSENQELHEQNSQALAVAIAAATNAYNNCNPNPSSGVIPCTSPNLAASSASSAPTSPRDKFSLIVNPPAAFASDEQKDTSGPTTSSALSSAQKERDLLIAQLLVTESKFSYLFFLCMSVCLCS